MALGSLRKAGETLATIALTALAVAQPCFAQSAKPPIIPPNMKSTAVPEIDFFPPESKDRSAGKAATKPAPIADPLPQAPRFAPKAPERKTPPPATPTLQTTRSPKRAEAPVAKPVEPPVGKAPERLAPPLQNPTPRKAEAESPWANIDAESIYRPLAAVVIEGEARRGGGEPYWQGSAAPPLPQQTPWPDAVPSSEFLTSPIEERPDISSKTFQGEASSDYWLRVAPASLLWQPPLAGLREPRMGAKALRIEKENVFDAAVGGQFGLLRISPVQRPDEGWQLDLFAVVFSRFRDGDLSALDYRFGVPLTYASGCWRFKLAYEHSRNRLQGDVANVAQESAHEFRREEAVFGVARTWDEILRVYGQVGVTISGTTIQEDEPFRYNLGFEWADLLCTTPSGAPFVAVDFEARGDQDYDANVTLQAGWNWRGRIPGRGPRVAGEYHRGSSPFGQTFTKREDWYGVTACFDW